MTQGVVVYKYSSSAVTSSRRRSICTSPKATPFNQTDKMTKNAGHTKWWWERAKRIWERQHNTHQSGSSARFLMLDR